MSQYPNGILLLSGTRKKKISVLLRAPKKSPEGSRAVNCSEMLSAALAPFGGRAGGRPDMAQGSVQEGSDLKAVEKAIKDMM